MKHLKKVVIVFCLLCSLITPVTAYATGDGNIDSGGGNMGDGTSINKWSSRDEGVRITVVNAADGSPVTTPIDLTNKRPSDIKIHFGKVCKSSYRDGLGLSARVGGYHYYNPAQSLPQIISTSSGGANLAAIKRYFTDEQVIRAIAGYTGMDFETLINGSYKDILFEEFISGKKTELGVGVLEVNGILKVLPICMITYDSKFFSNEVKFSGEGVVEKYVEINTPILKKASEIAKQIHIEMGCSGISRTDMVLTENDELYVLETNTLPGLLKNSLFPNQCKNAGISYKEMVDILLQGAYRRKPFFVDKK